MIPQPATLLWLLSWCITNDISSHISDQIMHSKPVFVINSYKTSLNKDTYFIPPTFSLPDSANAHWRLSGAWAARARSCNKMATCGLLLPHLCSFQHVEFFQHLSLQNHFSSTFNTPLHVF